MNRFQFHALRLGTARALRQWPIAVLLAGVLPAMAQTSGRPLIAPVPLDAVRCGALTSSYGPFDYRTDKDKLGIVERAHFTPAIANLVKEEGSAGTVDGDLHYTLTTFPNHHRALEAMLRLADRMKVRKTPYMRWEFECYPLRAISFRPDDAIPRMLYALYLNRNNRKQEAIAQLDATIPVAGESPITHYNLGLAFFECGEYQRALVQAHRAIAMGVPRTDLRERLRAAGRWVEPAEAPQHEAATPASGAASQ